MLDHGLAQSRMALVLGSGGVRSIAALGIAEVLVAEGIRPDLIVGCSSGALIGATIALRPLKPGGTAHGDVAVVGRAHAAAPLAGVPATDRTQVVRFRRRLRIAQGPAH